MLSYVLFESLLVVETVQPPLFGSRDTASRKSAWMCHTQQLRSHIHGRWGDVKELKDERVWSSQRPR